MLVTTYGLRRGFWLLDPRVISEEKFEVASLLDGIERVGRHVNLKEIHRLPKKIHLMSLAPVLSTLKVCVSVKAMESSNWNGPCSIQQGSSMQVPRPWR